jgi:hypothetical protein
MLNEQEDYPVFAACELLELSPSTYYYRPVQADENELEATIEEIAGQFLIYGTRRITNQVVEKVSINSHDLGKEVLFSIDFQNSD